MIPHRRREPDPTVAVGRWRRAARRLVHAIGTPAGRRHLTRLAADARDRVVGSVFRWAPLRPVGRAIHRRVCAVATRRPESVHTFFMRNRPLLEQIRKVVAEWPADHPIRRLPNVVLTPHMGYVTSDNYRLFYGDAVDDTTMPTLLGGDMTAIAGVLQGRGVPAAAFTAPVFVDFDGGGYRAPFAP